MIGVYDYTVLLTYLGFSCGVIGIVEAFNGKVLPAVICLMLAGLCDMFDGKVARTKKKRTIEERHFGIQLDSLSDLVCFGILPAMIGYTLMAKNDLGINRNWFLPIMVFYPLAALIRLAWFNVLEITRNSSSPVVCYTGLPVTSSALIFPFLFIFKKLLEGYCSSCFTYVYLSFLLIVGLLFISKIKIKKPSIKVMLSFILIGVIEVLLIITVSRLL